MISPIAIVEGPTAREYGDRALFGNQRPLPPRGFPAGRIRWRIRDDDFVRARVRTAAGVVEYAVCARDGYWQPAFEMAANQGADARPINYPTRKRYRKAIRMDRKRLGIVGVYCSSQPSTIFSAFLDEQVRRITSSWQ